MIVSLAIEFNETADALARFAREAADAGFNGLEVPISLDSPLSFDGPPATCHDFSKKVAEVGLSISAITLRRDPDAHLASSDAADRHRAYERALAALDRAIWLGTDLIVLTPAIFGGSRDPCTPARYEEVYGRAVESLLALRFEAQQRGVHIACVIKDTRFLLSPMEVRGFIDRVNSPFVGLSLDLGALLTLGCPQDWIASLGHRVFHVYMTDQRMGEAMAACNIGDGDVDWPSVRDALQAARFEGPLTLSRSHDSRDAMQRMARLFARTTN